MRYCLLMLILTAALVLRTGCERPDSKTAEKPAIDDKPLLLDDEPLLLLDDAADADEPEGPMADNSRCFVCHINYMQEDIAVTHARQGMGCAHCHGECDEHMADESWAWGENGTPPEIMYPKDKINPFCLGCHPKDKLPAELHNFLADASSKKTCTDCHGDHRLEERKCKWK